MEMVLFKVKIFIWNGLTLQLTSKAWHHFNGAKPVFSPRLIEWFQEAPLIGSVDLGEAQIRSGALLLVFLSKPSQFSTVEVGDILLEISHDALVKEFMGFTTQSVEAK